MNNYSQLCTPTSDTLAAYRNRGSWLIRRFLDQYGFDDVFDIEPVWVARWLVALKPSLSESAWRQYKASLLHILPEDDVARILEAEAQDGARKRGEATSAWRKKGIRYADYDKLRHHLTGSTRKRSNQLRDYLTATLICGLRCSEWWTAQRKGAWLVVQNGKHSKERTFGPERWLDLSPVSDDGVEAIEATLATFDCHDPLALQGLLTDLLRETCRQLWPRRKHTYSLYSARHQAIANAKALYRDPATVAAFAGHGSIATAQAHYGHTNKGKAFLRKKHELACPSPEHVATVEQLNRPARAATDCSGFDMRPR